MKRILACLLSLCCLTFFATCVYADYNHHTPPPHAHKYKHTNHTKVHEQKHHKKHISKYDHKSHPTHYGKQPKFKKPPHPKHAY